MVCDVAYDNVNNWLWTPFIERGPAHRIYIELKFSMRDCNLFPGMALSCKETFSLLYYEFDAATREPPPWEPESYRPVDRIAADEGRFTSNAEVIINTEVRSVPLTKKGVYFAFRDQGACLSLIAVKVRRRFCLLNSGGDATDMFIASTIELARRGKAAAITEISRNYCTLGRLTQKVRLYTC